ncbi:hypothetical protein HQ560_21595 [bacterium]|nr:hypothetical protein [bacterium]
MRVCVHDGVAHPWCSGERVAEYLARWFPNAEVSLLGDALAHAAGAEGLAERLCALRVSDPTRLGVSRRPLKPELDYERRVLAGATRAATGVVYDGWELQRLAIELLPPARRLDTIHIWLTERLIATWDEGDRRYHARASAYGIPSILSTAGLVHAPARERAVYLARRLGVPHTDEEDRIRPEDARTATVVEGYAMQAVFYALAGDPFCDDADCRLFNAHWQREVIRAQLGGDRYCPRHLAMLQEWA